MEQFKHLPDCGADTGKTRKARVAGKCQDCRKDILAGEKYVVGSQMDYQHGPHAHKRLCVGCASAYGLAEHAGAVCSDCGRTVNEAEYSYGQTDCCKAGVVPEEQYGKIDGFTGQL